MQLQFICGPRAMLSRFTIKRAKHYVLNWFNCLIFVLFGQSRASIILKGMVNNAVMKKKNIVLGFYLIRGKLQLLQTSVHIRKPFSCVKRMPKHRIMRKTVFSPLDNKTLKSSDLCTFRFQGRIGRVLL